MKLITNEDYYLVQTDEYCSTIGGIGHKQFNEGIHKFIGQVDLSTGKRNIFYNANNQSYVMFGAKDLSYVKSHHNKELVMRIELLEKELKELKKEVLKQ